MKLIDGILVLLAFPFVIGFWGAPIGIIYNIFTGDMGIGATFGFILLWIICGAIVLGVNKLRKRLKK